MDFTKISLGKGRKSQDQTMRKMDNQCQIIPNVASPLPKLFTNLPAKTAPTFEYRMDGGVGIVGVVGIF